MIEPPKPCLISGLKMPGHTVRQLRCGAHLLTVPFQQTEVTTLRILWPGGYIETPTPLHARIGATLATEESMRYQGAAIARAMDHAGAKMALTPGATHTALTLTALTSQTPKLLPVVSDMIANPVLDHALFEKIRRICAMQYLTSLADVECRADYLLQQMLLGPDYTPARILTEAEAMSVPLNEVKAYCHTALRRGRGAVVSLSGCVPAELEGAVEEMVDGLPTDGGTPQPLPRLAADEPGLRVEAVEGASQCAVSMGMPVPPLSDPRAQQFMHAVTALGGYFGSRLMTNIREEKGLTYGIYAAVSADPTGTFLQINAQCDRAYADAVIEETRAEMLRLAAEPPRGEELHRLRQSIGLELAAITDSATSTVQSLARELTGVLPYGTLQKRIDALDTVSTESIAEAAAAFLRPDQLRIAIAGNY